MDEIARIEQVLRGGSGAPALAETTSGERLVLKLKGSGGGERGLITELLGLRIAALLDVSVPGARPVFLRADFPWQAGTDEFDAVVQRSGGWNLGIAWIEDASAVKDAALDALPADFLSALARADALLVNVDRSRGNLNILRDAAGAYFAIDYGACLFLDRLLAGKTERPDALPPRHFLSGTPFDGPVRDRLDASCLRALLDEVPAEWWLDLSLSRTELAARLVSYFADES